MIHKAEFLTETALPYIQKFKGKVFVIKYGGNAMKSEALKDSVMKDIALLHSIGIKVAIVHGGGPNISEEMRKAGVEPKFVNGLRVTDKATVGIVERTSAAINGDIRDTLKSFNVGSENVQDALIAEQKNPELGFVGEVTEVLKEKILDVIEKGEVPVISPLGIGRDRTKYNINADTAAVKVAVALDAEKLTLLTDVDGVLEDGRRISHLSIKDAHEKIAAGVITKGMIPKVEACIEAVEAGCRKAHLINGTVPHSILYEIFTNEGIGTEIVRNGRK